jgi:prevent-host-death family protein
MAATSAGTWKLEDAKARFSEVVRRAAQEGPQRVTVHGREAAVVISAEEYARLTAARERPGLHELLSRGPLRDLDFGEEGVRSPVRDVDL